MSKILKAPLVILVMYMICGCTNAGLNIEDFDGLWKLMSKDRPQYYMVWNVKDGIVTTDYGFPLETKKYSLPISNYNLSIPGTCRSNRITLNYSWLDLVSFETDFIKAVRIKKEERDIKFELWGNLPLEFSLPKFKKAAPINLQESNFLNLSIGYPKDSRYNKDSLRINIMDQFAQITDIREYIESRKYDKPIANQFCISADKTAKITLLNQIIDSILQVDPNKEIFFSCHSPKLNDYKLNVKYLDDALRNKMNASSPLTALEDIFKE